MDIMKVMKLIWAADRFHVRKYGAFITNDTYYAMLKGPVGSLTLNILNEDQHIDDEILKCSGSMLKRNCGYNIESIADVNQGVFSETELEALKFSWDNFGQYDHWNLSQEISHRYPEWKKHEKPLESKIANRCDLDPMDFFEDPSDGEEDPFKLDKGLLEINKSIFLENMQVNPQMQ